MTLATIPAAALDSHLAILGMTGSGKTSTAKLAVEQIVAQGGRVCILDPIKSDHWGLVLSRDGKKPGLPFTILGGPHGHMPLSPHSGAAIARLVGSGALHHSILDLSDLENAEPSSFYIDFMRALWKSSRGVLHLVLEEAHEFAPKTITTREEPISVKVSKKLATGGRTKGIRLIVTTQRTANLHNDILSSCEYVIAQRTNFAPDQKPILDWVKGRRKKEEVQVFEASLPELEDGEGWIMAGRGGQFERVKFKMHSTYDNTKTPTMGSVADVKVPPIDQEKLRAVLGEAAKEIEANDPKRLKARIEELEKAAARKDKSQPAVPARCLKCEELRRQLDGARSELEGDRERYKHNEERMTEAANRFAEGRHLAQGVIAGIKRIIANYDQENNAGAEKDLETFARQNSKMMVIHEKEQIPRAPAARPAKPPVLKRPAEGSEQVGAPAGSIELTPAEKDLVGWVYWWQMRRRCLATREMLAACLGVHINTKSFVNRIGKLRTLGAIEYEEGGVCMGPIDGLDRFQTRFPVDSGIEIRSSQDLRNTVAIGLEGKARQIFEHLSNLTNRGPVLSREQLAEAMGNHVNTKTFVNGIGKLRGRGLVEYTGRGVELAEWLTMEFL